MNDLHQLAREWAGKWCKSVETEGPPLQPDEFNSLVSHFLAALEQAVKPLVEENERLQKTVASFSETEREATDEEMEQAGWIPKGEG